MRPNCPLCGKQPKDNFVIDYAMPDDWKLPTRYNWRYCECGFIWADTDKTVNDFDEHYRQHYNPSFDEHDQKRIDDLADFIFQFVKPDTHIVDFGGGAGQLRDALKIRGFRNVEVVNLDDEMPECEVVILSQTIEHLYDLERDIKRIDAKLKPRGVVIVETPDAIAYSGQDTPQLLDYYPTHVNHFSLQTLTALWGKYGYSAVYQQMGLYYPPTNAFMLRSVFSKGEMDTVFARVKEHLNNIEPINIQGKVVIYGLGDLTLHQIALSDFDIAYFVDENPVYNGATINGIPIKQTLDDDEYPVLVIGNRNRETIVSKLKGRQVIAP